MVQTRVLHVDLAALGRGACPASSAPAFEEPWRTMASWGGSALGLACLREALLRGGADSPALVVAVGEAVRAGLPTAARAAVLARAPLSGLYAEGHVGGELGARLAGLADALLLTGRAPHAGSVLVLEREGTCRLLPRPGLRGQAPAEVARTLEGELGPCAVLTIGAAGEAGLPFASLASGYAPPSFVGRGGLGAVFGALGLKALCVRAPLAASTTPREEAAELLARLTTSPRLAARAQGGTLELFEAWAVREGEESARGRALAEEARERADARHGCRGCPTPCGWVFARSDGPRQGARFGASQALGVALGLGSLDEALALLATCDRFGVDAKEVGSILALRCLAEERGRLTSASARGRRDELARRIEALVLDPRAPGRRGAAQLALELGLEQEVPASRGQAVRPEANRAALLGQCVASGGADPMRSFPFLLESVELERLRALLAPLPVPEAALDLRSGEAKGRLVFWHENLISAVDMTGFCAFSAAGLLADGLAELDELARWILPAALRAPSQASWAGLRPGMRLLAAGANLVLARRELNQFLGAPADGDRPPFARAALDEPGMLDEYRALRGLEGNGGLRAEMRDALGTPAVLRADLGSPATPPAGLAGASDRDRGAEAAVPVALGGVTLRSSGPLAEALGADRRVELPLPATVRSVLGEVGRSDAVVRARLFHGASPIPAVWRAGHRLRLEDLVQADDVLELVVAIAGG